MSLDTLALIALVLAAIPCGLFLVNLLVYRRLPGGAREVRAGRAREDDLFETRVAHSTSSPLSPLRGEGVAMDAPRDSEDRRHVPSRPCYQSRPAPEHGVPTASPREDDSATRAAIAVASAETARCAPSPLNGERAGVRGEAGQRARLLPSLSVLIPARNEEQNIRATMEAVLANRGADFEVIVLDDHSTDRTAAIVGELAARDPRVRLASAPPLPAGWCGKPHACFVLAKLARHPLLLFIDADVRLAPDALARMAAYMGRGFYDLTIDDLSAGQIINHKSSIINAPALTSGVPRQELGTFSERLLLPLIHFILLGFLPMHAMRRTRWAAMSAGCGQLFLARRDPYFAAGGHAAIRATLHDGVKLPRALRRAGYATDLFDATDLATCRMYHTNADTWRGLGRNATEGLAAPGVVLPMTALLLVGQVLPLALLACAPLLSPLALTFTVTAKVLALLPRLVGVVRFRQPPGSALLHPLGVVALVVIQWHALLRHLAGKPAQWKGRSYATAPVHHVAKPA